jgi:tetratricopeptide (TPR) repeat protein
MDGITLGIGVVKFLAGEAASIALQNLLPYKSLEKKVVQALGNALDKVARGNEFWKKDVKIQESAVIDALIWMIDSPDAPIPTNLFDKDLLVQFKSELEKDANTWAYLQILLLNHRLKKSNEKNEKEIRRLDDKINELLQNINANIRFLTSVPAWADVDNVIGREDDLEKLWKELSERKRVLLTGLGGIGKTKLAQMLFHNYRDRFEEVAWIDYKVDLKHSFLACVNVEGFNKGPQNEDERWEAMKSSLLNDGKKKLFIIDNVDDDTDQRPENDKELRALTGWDNTTILLTSRLDRLNPYILHELKELGKDDCKAVFNHYYGGNDPNPELVGKIVKLANYHTLTIELLAKGARRENLESYYEKIKNGFETVLRKMGTEHHDGNATIEAHLKILFDLQQRSDMDKKVLNSFAVLPVNCECSLEEIEQWFGFGNEDLDEVIKDGWLSFDKDEQTFSMHPLIRTIIRFDFLEDGQGKKTIAPEGTTDEILEYFDEHRELDLFDINMGFVSLQRMIGIVEAVISAVDEKESVRLARLYHRIGWSYKDLGDYNKALEYYGKALEIKESKLGKDHPSTATTYNNIAGVYRAKGYYDKALEYYEKDREISESKLGKDHPSTATTYNNIAGVYEDMGDYDKALEYYEMDREISESKLGKDHLDTATTYNNIAGVYDNMGDYDKALEYYEKALEIRESKLGKDHPSTATTYNNIAGVYDDMDDYDKALEYYEKALEIRESKLGKDHPFTAMTYNNIALVYKAKGDYDKALEYYEKDREISESKLGKDHPSMATTYNNIAGVYEDMGNYDKALEYYEKDREISEFKLGKDHPSTATTYNNIAGVYEDKGDYDKALEYFLKALKILLIKNKNHPNTTSCFMNLAICYQKANMEKDFDEWLEEQFSTPPEPSK